MTEPASDLELLRGSGEGDHEAFTVFADRHAESVFRFLRSLGAASDDAEDALQECFVAAWRGARTYSGTGAARSWLFSIARNALLRQHRKRAGEPDSVESLEELGDRAGWGATLDLGSRFDALDELDWALQRMPAEEREVVVLRDIEDFTGTEAAEALGLSVAAMKSRLHRGRLRLMGILRSLDENDA